MRLLPLLLLLLSACAAELHTLNLMVHNGTKRPETLAVSIRDKRSGEELYRESFHLLPQGVVEKPGLLEFPWGTYLELCATLPAYPERPQSHLCRAYFVHHRDFDVDAFAFPGQVTSITVVEHLLPEGR